MLGHNLPVSALIHDKQLTDQYFLGLPQLGTIGDIHADTLILSWVSMGFILLAGAMIVPTLKADGPGGKGQALLEGLYLFIQDLTKGQMGHHYRTYMPLIAAIFAFVLVANFVGIGPWKFFEHQMSWWPHVHGEPFELCSPTTDFNCTFGLAIVSLLTYLGAGFASHGPGYLKAYLASGMAPIEWLDLIVRPTTLALRLMMVITADELMRAAALSMVPVILPTFVMGFEMFIGVIQAFVFALLTTIYIGLTVSSHH